MMIVQMDKEMSAPAPSARERAQRLYKKNIELENKRRRSVQARIPSDPNAWQQMRENYESIILEDHAFSEQHNIEYALWQLHYRRIEELRAHYTSAVTSSGSNTTEGARVPSRTDRVTKIRLQFKTFLSEATGFYHELIMKIRAKYGLPLGYFSKDSENGIIVDKDGKKSAELKKGLVSCHRCLIYLGDLARYKGLYGDGDSKSREYAAASSYYLQAASLWPSSGNPHHQLAILASYSADELLAVYRYFRSLAVDSPFSTARDNLIVAFEKNRQSYSQMSADIKSATAKETDRLTGKERGKVEAKLASKDTDKETSSVKESVSGVQEKRRAFRTSFVRLNGILFTRTSLETFTEVLALASSGLSELLSFGPEEALNFGSDANHNALFIVRLVSILIFTIHNLKTESENQTYAEIVQRAALLQNAFTAVFELMAHIIERCIQQSDPSSSYLLPGILVFVEWLACCPDIASGSDADERQTTVRSNFWSQCISFLNKILSVAPVSVADDEDLTCFFNMSKYDEGETGNRLALWEDIELRGFLPLLPAHTILDFTRKHSFGGDGNKEGKARVKRILAAGKALVNVVMVDQKPVCFDSKLKKFVIGAEPLDNVTFTSYSDIPKTGDFIQEDQAEKGMNFGVVQANPQVYVDGEDEDEVIVFKPSVTEKTNDVIGSTWMYYDWFKLGHSTSVGDLQLYAGPGLTAEDNLRQNATTTFDSSLPVPVSVGNILAQNLQPVQPPPAKQLMEEELSLANSLKGLRLPENGNGLKNEISGSNGISIPAARTVPIQQSVNVNTSGMLYSLSNGPGSVIASRVDALASSRFPAHGLAAPSPFPAGLGKNPVSRPVRHLGPPPGFSPVPCKQVTAPSSGSELINGNPLMDDYSWLDGYQLPPSAKGPGLGSTAKYFSHVDPRFGSNSNDLAGTVSFPFPGKQVPAMQSHAEKHVGWQEYQSLEHLKLQHEQQLQQQQLKNRNQFTPLPDQYQGQSIWNGRYLV